MNENTPMTPAQQLFAEEHHNLVYAFLNEKKLPEDEYYDVVVFGYLSPLDALILFLFCITLSPTRK